MAVFTFIPVAGAGNGTSAADVIYSATLGAAATSGTVTVGNDQIIRIAFTGPITIRFGTTANLSGQNAGTGDMLFPWPDAVFYDMGHQNTALSVYSLNANTTICISRVNKN